MSEVKKILRPTFETVTCPVCGKITVGYKSSHRKFCSLKCFYKSITKNKKPLKIGTWEETMGPERAKQRKEHLSLVITGHPPYCKKRVTYITRVCAFCEKLFKTINQPSNRKNCCSFSCARKYTGKIVGEMRTGKSWEEFYSNPEEAKRKMVLSMGNHPSIKQKCIVCGKEFLIQHYRGKAKYCSKECYWKDKKTPARIKADIRRTHCGPNSYPQKSLFGFLKTMFPNIDYNYCVPNNITWYSLDIADADNKIDIEVDGEYWHSTKEQKEHDKKRDLFLIGNGWKVFRVPAKNVRNIITSNFTKPVTTLENLLKEFKI